MEIAKFHKTENELETLFDKWLYVLRNLSRLDRQPATLKEKVFSKVFKESAIARFSRSELREYEDSLKVYRDLKNSLDTALMQGMEKGLEQGRAEGEAHGVAKVAKAMLANGMSVEDVAEITGLDSEALSKL